MPQVMTEEEANSVLCPHMSHSVALADGRSCFEPITCQGHGCACWGWVDGEEGEEDHTNVERINLKHDSRDQLPDTPVGGGVKWRKSHTVPDKNGEAWVTRFWRPSIKGPRRGQCEAMSPNITVETG